MRFACEQCQAKYSIPDARVAGKVVRLRCQRCGSEITVRGPPAGASEEAASPPLEAPAPKPASKPVAEKTPAEKQTVENPAAEKPAAAKPAEKPRPVSNEDDWRGSTKIASL